MGCSAVLPAVVALAAVTLASVMVAAATAAPPGIADDVPIMRRLRGALRLVDPAWAGALRGWQPGSQAHPCTWRGVKCDGDKHITTIYLDLDGSQGGGTTASQPHTDISSPSLQAALGGLARLPALDTLAFGKAHYSWPAVPAEWLGPGAFPSLTWLSLTGSTLGTPLPDVPPGALPRLEYLCLEFHGLRSTLPAAWGADPAVLPSLQELRVEAQLEGGLPAQWGKGFRQLAALHLYSLPLGFADTRQARTQQSTAAAIAQWHTSATAAAAATAGAAAARGSSIAAAPARGGKGAAAAPPLPAQWADPGSFPQLQVLDLFNLELTGPLPRSWQDGGFPMLQDLLILYVDLTGTLPPQLFQRHSKLNQLSLGGTRLTGPLPDAWGSSQVELLHLGGNSLLSGPALPPAWLQPGALPHLINLDLSNNPGLTGSLPAASPPWPLLRVLNVSGSGVAGSISAAWCGALFARSLSHLDFQGTSVNPTLPRCAATSFPAWKDKPALPGTAQEGGLGGALNWAKSHAPAAAAPPSVLTVAALLVPMAAAAAAGHAVLQHRRRRQPQQGSSAAKGAGRSEHELLCLLREQERERHSQQSSSGKLRQDVSDVRHRIQSLEAALSKGSDPRSTMKLHRIQQLPAAATKAAQQQSQEEQELPAAARMAAQQQSQQQQELPAEMSHELNSGGCSLSPETHTTHDSLPSQTAFSTGGAARAAAAQHALRASGEGPSALAAGGVHMTTAGLPSSRPWRLGTSSLQLARGQLEFARNKSGELVILGHGSKGVVLQARIMPDGVLAAAKVFDLHPTTDSGAVWKEVALLRQCSHDRIVPLYGVAIRGSFIALAMPLMEGGTLHAALKAPNTRHKLRWAAGGRQLAIDVAEGLAYLHSSTILHGDLKPTNILLTANLRACIGDLGVAQVLASRARLPVGLTVTYAAPEQLLGARCTLAADLYSFGLVLMQLITQQEVTRRAALQLPHTPHECSQTVLELIHECTSPHPERRPSAVQALERLRQDQTEADMQVQAAAQGEAAVQGAAGAHAAAGLQGQARARLDGDS